MTQPRSSTLVSLAKARRPVPWLLAAAVALLTPMTGSATTPLADQPIFSNSSVPGNLALTLSVEYPTAVSVAHTDTTYNPAKTYQGYFDHNKCYLYSWNTTEALRHFYPAGSASSRTCTGTHGSKWAGNFLNWATTQTIDPFRWVLTGGYRQTDTATLTIIEKAWASGQGGTGNFPDRSLGTSTLVADNTPLGWSNMNLRVQGLGNKLRFTGSGDLYGSATAYNPANSLSTSTVYELSVRVKVCDSDITNAGPLEKNCTAYPAGNYKPTGLIQKYADRIRYSAFGYLNDSNKQRDGGVLRAQQKFVGPTYTLPSQPQTTNTRNEWDPDNGVFTVNPDSSDATSTATLFGVSVTNSGVINYLNKFGQVTPGSYKTYDNVSELYYAAIRYFKNQGNVPEWTARGSADTATKTTWVDGFPVIESWTDPILYSCQKNFVLGIGDVNTWTDKNVPGSTGTTGEPSMPSAVSNDTTVNAKTATDKVGSLHGLGSNLGSSTNSQEIPGSYHIAGLAYDSNTKDIRPDDASKPHTAGKQTIQTYWLDVLEYSSYVQNNQYYLAAKYGGFKVPAVFDPYTRSSDIPLDWWSTTGDTVYGQNRPDNYFVAAEPDDMINGLNKAFASIAASLRAYTTSFATAAPQIQAAGTASYSAQFDSSNWTGEVTAATAVFDPASITPTLTEHWKFSDKLRGQTSGTGWNTGRRMVTWNNSSNTGVPFRAGNLAATQLTALDTVYRSGNDSADYVNYLRGDSTHEENSSASGSAKIYRNRDTLVGDIVNAKPKVVLGPSLPLSDATNPGYSTFRTTWANRQPMVYVGTNGGMLHAINASTTGTDAGKEVFAYVPGALYLGPTGTPAVNGLAARGDPDFTHKNFVDGKTWVMDVDFGRTQGNTGTDWRTVLIGGLGKGSKSYFALDVTNPGGIDMITTSVTTETNVATRVLWEFSHADLGYTYGEPTLVKTAQYGWTLIFGSGYNNNDGKGYFFFVNPRTGALLQKVEAKTATGPAVGSSSNQAGLAHVQAFVPDRTNGTAETVYAGDLLGNLWRLDVRAASGSYPAPTLLATLEDSANLPQPVTSRPVIITQPVSNRRWVTVGTGRLLDNSDIPSTQSQAMYAIIDGTGLAFAATPPAGFSYPIARNKLKQLTDLTAKVTLDFATQIGWYVDLGTTAGVGWRVINDSSSFYGVVEFTTMLPNNEVCNPSGTSRLYAIDLGTGQSNLLDDTPNSPINARKAFHAVTGGLATEQGSISVISDKVPGNPSAGQNAKRVLMVCSTNGSCEGRQPPPPPGLLSRRLNWRELPLAN